MKAGPLAVSLFNESEASMQIVGAEEEAALVGSTYENKRKNEAAIVDSLLGKLSIGSLGEVPTTCINIMKLVNDSCAGWMFS